MIYKGNRDIFAHSFQFLVRGIAEMRFFVTGATGFIGRHLARDGAAIKAQKGPTV
jgi:FlaA1/EpsC-like NDP-sugar epimerase